MKKSMVLSSIILLVLSVPLSYAGDTGHGGSAMASNGKMQGHMKKMNQQMAKIHSTKDPDKLDKLIADHMQSMHDHMKMMHGMMGGKSGDMSKRMGMMEQRMDMMQMMVEQVVESGNAAEKSHKKRHVHLKTK